MPRESLKKKKGKKSEYRSKYSKSRREGLVSSLRSTGALPKGGSYASMREAEKKGMDSIIEDALQTIPKTTNTNDQIYGLNLVLEGSGSFNRIGRKIKMKSLDCRVQIVCPMTPDATTGNIGAVTVRVAVIYDKFPQSNSIPAWSDIFTSTTRDGSETSLTSSAVRYDAMNRFVILRDQVFVANPGTLGDNSGSTAATTPEIWYKDFIKLDGLMTTYSANAGAYTDIETGGLLVAFRQIDNSADTANICQITTRNVFRLRYYG